MGTAINHGTDQDKNIIVQVTHDVAGRVTSLRDPRGNLTEYEYDQLGRRTLLTNPLDKEWETAHEYVAGGGTRTTLSDPNGVDTQRDFDRLGRLQSIQYGSPPHTPDVQFAYDVAGNRTQMTEYSGASFTSPVRGTTYSYDDARRLTSVGFDTDGDSSVDETVSYDYDVAGNRTRMTLPGSLEIAYQYDSKGQLVALTDWDDQTTQFAYDNAGRMIASQRANGLRSRYRFDAAGRLRVLRHSKGFQTLAHFAYEVDGRGNRTQALECVPHPSTTNDTTYPYDESSIVYRGSWTDDDPYMLTTAWSDSLEVGFFGDAITFTISEGPDRSRFDVYINESLWQSIDGYADSVADREITVELDGEGPHLFEIRNRKEKNPSSSGYSVRFKQLVVADQAYDLHTIEYVYDGISRLQEARYNPGVNTDVADGDLLRRYQFDYDLAGNRTGRTVHIDGAQDSDITYTYNVANQLVYDGTNNLTYDDNGNLTSDGVNSYTWDRANRMLTAPGSTSYQYDGVGNRIRQTVSSIVTDYLNDVQPGLTKLLAQTTGANTERFIHSPMGIHAMEDNSGNWTYPVQDGLGSVRGVVSDALAVNGMQHYTPYGDPFGAQGSLGMDFGFTGEQTDGSGQVFLRARYYDPSLGVFSSLDPFEGVMDRPMSLNGYSWVSGNPINNVDPSGMQDEERHLANALSSGSCPEIRLPRRCYCLYFLERLFCELGISAECELNYPPPGSQPPGDELLASMVVLLGSDCSNDPNQKCQCINTDSGYWSLGTLTPEGLWTHDHYAKKGDRDDFMRGDVKAGFERLQSYDCIAFRGAFGDISMPVDNVSLSPSSVPGSMLIRQIYPLMTPYNQRDLEFIPDLTNIGQPVCGGSFPTGHQMVDFVYIPGENQDCLDWICLRLGHGILNPIPNSEFSSGAYNLFEVSNSQPELPTGGDSGGGLFLDGKLVAVLQATHANPFTGNRLSDLNFYTPIAGAYSG